jgi:hypothetical protein
MKVYMVIAFNEDDSIKEVSNVFTDRGDAFAHRLLTSRLLQCDCRVITRFLIDRHNGEDLLAQ